MHTEFSSEIEKLVFHILEQAHHKQASDIHWEPTKTSIRIRFRIDGILQEVQLLSKKLHRAIINRLKILTGSMDIAEKRRPQEGRFRLLLNHQMVDFRVACVPTLHGESLVLRLLESSSLLHNLSELGLEQDDHALLEKIIQHPDGLVLVTGPTGSGKTTSLYAILSALNTPQHKIITVEDPVEYQIPGINQVAVQETIGRTFPIVLRAMLRQATNIMMVGEIRDQETANIVINAALTGHLLFSTLHANDAVTTLTRMEDLQIPSFLLSSTLHGVIAQRLVRRLCAYCKCPTSLSSYEIEAFQLTSQQLAAATPMKSVGCAQCHYKGFKGRLGIFEILLFDEELRASIFKTKNISERRQIASDHGMRTLREDALRKMLRGLTTVEEVIHQLLNRQV